MVENSVQIFRIIRIYHESVDRIDNSVSRVTVWNREAPPSNAKL